MYIHGMGGGSDSRIPRLLREWSEANGRPFEVICRTYDFNPRKAAAQIHAWEEEVKPNLVIGESLGACHALRMSCPVKLFVSPALGAPAKMGKHAPLAAIPGVPFILGRIYKPRPGDRQQLRFSKENLMDFRWLQSELEGIKSGNVHAFFGLHDHYMKNGVVSIPLWEEKFGTDSYETYDGTHFMEEEFVLSLLIPAVLERL